MTSRSHEEHLEVVKPPRLDRREVDDLLSKRLIANLATLDDDGGIHVVPMWFRREGDHILIPTSRFTRKYGNVSKRPRASVMVDISRAGLNLRGVLIRGGVEIVRGDEARRLNRSIHLRYVTEEGLELDDVKPYLVEGDDVTIKIAMERIVTWNNAESPAGKAISAAGAYHDLDS